MTSVPARESIARGFRWMVAGTLVALGIVAVLFWPRGPVQSSEGRITSLELINGVAFVAVADGRTVRVHLPRRHRCRVGDRIRLTERRTLWGMNAAVAPVPHPCLPG